MPEPLPYADAGFDQVRHLGGNAASGALSVELDGRASCDPMGLAFEEATWSVVSAPGRAPEPVAGSKLRASFAATEPGEYVLALQVTYGGRLSEPDYVAIRIEPGEGEDVVVAPPGTTACGDPIDD